MIYKFFETTHLFRHLFEPSRGRLFLQFTYPWTLTQNHQFLNRLVEASQSQSSLPWQRGVLCKTNGGYYVEVITIASTGEAISGKPQIVSQSFDSRYMPPVYPGKIGVFISARVHPGETAASHILNGLLSSLLGDQPLIQALKEKIVFYIVPILNPDGVAAGNFRTDLKGNNLNRFYTDPSRQEHPSIFYVKEMLLNLIRSGHVSFCLDLHAHVNKQGLFMYGNSVQNLSDQVKVLMFPKLMEMCSEYFDFDSCNFSSRNMGSGAANAKGDEASKEGASRVAIYKDTGLIDCWTMECNYSSTATMNTLDANTLSFLNGSSLKNQQGQKTNKVPSLTPSVLLQRHIPSRQLKQVFFGLGQFHRIGRSILLALGHYFGICPKLNAPFTLPQPFYSTENLQIHLAATVLRREPYRFGPEAQKAGEKIRGNGGRQAVEIIQRLLFSKKDDKLDSLGKDITQLKPKIHSSQRIDHQSKDVKQKCPSSDEMIPTDGKSAARQKSVQSSSVVRSSQASNRQKSIRGQINSKGSIGSNIVKIPTNQSIRSQKAIPPKAKIQSKPFLGQAASQKGNQNNQVSVNNYQSVGSCRPPLPVRNIKTPIQKGLGSVVKQESNNNRVGLPKETNQNNSDYSEGEVQIDDGPPTDNTIKGKRNQKQ